MMDRRALLASALSLPVLSACGGGGEKPKNEVIFSILSTESAQNMEDYWTPILADMEKQTGLKVKPYFSSSYSALVESMRFKKIDLGWFSNQSGLEAVRRANGEVFARTFDDSDTDGYKSVIIVPANSPIKTIDDLLKCDKTLNFGMGDAKSTSGTLAPVTLVFQPAGKRPDTCFKTVISANHQANLFAVANGKLDAATNNSTAIALNAKRGEGQAEKIRVIWESPTLPEDPIIWRKDLDPAVKEKLRQFFLTYGQGDSPEAKKAREYMAALSIGGFKPADESHLLFVREMEAAGQLGEAKETNNPAAVAAAQKNLDGIRAEAAAAKAKAGQ